MIKCLLYKRRPSIQNPSTHKMLVRDPVSKGREHMCIYECIHLQKSIFVLFEIRSHYVTLTGLELTVDQPTLELIEIYLYLPPEKRLEGKKNK